MVKRRESLKIKSPVKTSPSLRSHPTREGDRRPLLGRFRLMDMATKVVGVGSVGTFRGIILLMSSEHDSLFLHFKRARSSVVEDYAGKSLHANHGQRVVHGCRISPLPTRANATAMS